LRLQELMEGAAGTRDARHNSADGDVKDEGDVSVLDLFNVAKEENFAELWQELLECTVEGCLIVKTDEVVFRSGAGDGVECVWMIFEEDCAGGGDAGARGEKGVAEYAEDPSLKVRAGLEGIESSEGLGKSFLHEVFSLGLIAAEPEGVVVERSEEWERELLKLRAVGGFGEHGAVCLDLAGVAECGPWSGTRPGVIPTTKMLGGFQGHSKVRGAGWPESGRVCVRWSSSRHQRKR
jgi:hypothetical protein